MTCKIDDKGNGATARLLEGMQAVQERLVESSEIDPQKLAGRLREWQQMVEGLSERVSQREELATLYELIKVMNASLDLEDTLGLVMDSLIKLTGAERGCLMLLDDDGDLEIQAARHFDRQSIDDSDLELSHTVVQKALKSEEPVLTTNAQVDPRFSGQESVVGYHLRSIICVPLQVREREIGALYLDNHIREGAFSEDDLPVLTAFANQAAIAIDNARLYTTTDQELAARVDELTMLQRIDRELNASLDFERVLDLTLSWALRATGAEGGALCILEEDGAVQEKIVKGNGMAVSTLEPEEIALARQSAEPIVVGRLRILVPIRLEGRTMGMIDLQSDGSLLFRTEHVELAGRLADHAAVAIENARLYEKVQRANQAKSEFVSFVAHELRTPMTSIRGYADMLEREVVGPLTSRQAEFAKTIRRNVERMKILVAHLQDISRIETGQLSIEPEPVALSDALEGALESTRAQIEGRSQQLTTDIPDDLPIVCADPSRLTQILTNLLSNASKYTPEEGGIHVRAWKEGEYIHCAVSDTGIGISAEDRARLFTKFFRADDPAVQEMPGTGLGLCIVRNLVEMQGGEIRVESEPGEGSTFTFTIPLAD